MRTVYSLRIFNIIPTLASEMEDKLYAVIEQNNPDLLDDFLNNTPYDFITINPFKKYLTDGYELTDMDLKIINVLLKHNASVNEYIDRYEDRDLSATLLHRVCDSRDLTFAKLMVNEGHDLNLNDIHGECTLKKALDNYLWDVVNFLVLCGAHIPWSCCFYRGTRTQNEILMHLANLTGDLENNWNELSLAAYQGDVKSVKRLILTRKYFIDVLTLYCAVVSRSYEIFEIIWTNIDTQIVNSATRLMNLIFETWWRSTDLINYKLLLTRQDVDLKLFKYGHHFVTFLFSCLALVSSVETIMDDMCNIVENFARRGLRLTSSHVSRLIGIVWDYKPSSNLTPLFKVILQTTLPNITLSVLDTNFYSTVTPLLIPYCFHLNDEIIYAAIYTWHISKLPKLLGFLLRTFTITKKKKEMLVVYLENVDTQLSEKLRLFNQGSGGVKSLVEISRDSVRRHFTYNMLNTRQFINVLERINLPLCVKDIILYKTPMYNHIW